MLTSESLEDVMSSQDVHGDSGVDSSAANMRRQHCQTTAVVRLHRIYKNVIS